jgi:hypothetical protein
MFSRKRPRDFTTIKGGVGISSTLKVVMVQGRSEIIAGIHVDSGFVLGWQLKLDDAGHG